MKKIISLVAVLAIAFSTSASAASTIKDVTTKIDELSLKDQMAFYDNFSHSYETYGIVKMQMIVFASYVVKKEKGIVLTIDDVKPIIDASSQVTATGVNDEMKKAFVDVINAKLGTKYTKDDAEAIVKKYENS